MTAVLQSNDNRASIRPNGILTAFAGAAPAIARGHRVRWLKRSAIYQRMSEGRFPRSRSLGPKCAVGVEAEIDDWIHGIALK